MLKLFRDFAPKDHVVDLPIVVIAGAVCGATVCSLAGDAFMPVIGLIVDRLDFSNLSVVPSNPNSVVVASLAAATEAVTASHNIGLFTNAVVKFAIVALVLFLVVKGTNTIRNKQAAASAA